MQNIHSIFARTQGADPAMVDTHMPFMFRHDGREAALFCGKRAANTAWDVFYFAAGADAAVPVVGLNDIAASKCNPYVVNTAAGRMCYFRLWPAAGQLCRMPMGLYRCPFNDDATVNVEALEAVSFDTARQPFCAYHDPDVTAAAFTPHYLFVRTGAAYFKIDTTPERIYRIMRAGLPGTKLLVTGENAGQKFTRLLDVDAMSWFDLKAPAEDYVYKAHISGAQLVYAHVDVERRTLRASGYELHSSRDVEFVAAHDNDIIIPDGSRIFSLTDQVMDMLRTNTPKVPATLPYAPAYDAYKDRASAGSVSVKMTLLSPMDRPTGPELAENFDAVMRKWADAGYAVVTKSEFARRSEICSKCPMWEPAAYSGLGRCRKCGCAGGKRWLAQEKCPMALW